LISLPAPAHSGVASESGSRVLEVLRQRMEDKAGAISRTQGSVTLPANFQLLAAKNPCLCGF